MQDISSSQNFAIKSALKIKRILPFYYGWLILLIAGLSIFFTAPGQTYSFTLFIDRFISDFGWSRNQVSGMYTVSTLLSGSLMFIMGRFIDRQGARIVLILSVVLLAIGCFFNSFVSTLPMLLLGFFINRFAGQATLGLAASTFAPMWFIKKCGFATMIVGLGGTVSGVVFPLLNNRLINQFGWQNTFRILGISLILLLLPIASLFLVNRPEDLGLSPDNSSVESDQEPSKTPIWDDDSLSPKEAAGTVPFWILTVSMFQFALVIEGIGFNYVSIIKEKGFDEHVTASIMSVGQIPGFFTFVMLGLMIDRLKKPEYLMGIALTMEAVLIFLLAAGQGKEILYIRSILSGISSASYLLCFGLMKPYLFGRNYIGGISGVIAISGVIGSGIGPIIFSVANNFFGGYYEILVIMSLFSALTGIAAFFIKRPMPHSIIEY